MSFVMRCSACNKRLQVPDRKAGKKAHCAKCGQRLQIPGVPPNRTVLTPLAEPTPAEPVICPGCGRQIPLGPDELSLPVECARCGAQFTPAVPPTRSPDNSRPESPGGFVPFNGGFSPWSELSVLAGLFLLFVFFITPSSFPDYPFFQLGFLVRSLGVLVALGLLVSGAALLIAGRGK